jgi:hypothetical protein
VAMPVSRVSPSAGSGPQPEPTVPAWDRGEEGARWQHDVVAMADDPGSDLAFPAGPRAVVDRRMRQSTLSARHEKPSARVPARNSSRRQRSGPGTAGSRDRRFHPISGAPGDRTRAERGAFRHRGKGLEQIPEIGYPGGITNRTPPPHESLPSEPDRPSSPVTGSTNAERTRRHLLHPAPAGKQPNGPDPAPCPPVGSTNAERT